MRGIRFSQIGRRLLLVGVAIGCTVAGIPSAPANAALPMTGDASLYYATQASATSPYKTYTGLTSTWSAAANMGTEANAVHFIRTVNSPVRNEKLTLLSDTNGLYKLYRWNGATWTLDWTDTGGGGSATTYTPRFDIAYDYLGDALVVYSNNVDTTGQMALRKFTGSTGTWAAKQNYTAGATQAPLSERYIRVESRPGTDEFAFLWADASQNLSGNYYDFSANTFAGEPAFASPAGFTNNLSILTGAGTEIRTRVFDMAFETNSGKLLLCYGSDGITDLLCYSRTAGMAGTWQPKITYATATIEGEDVDMAANPDPASNQIAIYTYNSTVQDGEAEIWSGTAWGNTSVFDSTMGTLAAGTSNGAVEWLRSGTNSRAIITYDDAATSAGIDWVVWNGTTWTVQTDNTTAFSTAGANDLWHEMVRDPNNTAQLASIIVDSNADIGVKRLTLTGTTLAWSSLDNAGVSHNTNMHTSGGWSSAFAWANYLMPAVLSVDIVDAAGASVVSPSVTMAPLASSSTCQTTTASFGTSSQMIRVSNGTTNPSWSLSIAATGGSTAKWSATTESFDYNDNTSTGCADGADADTDAGRLTFSSAVGTIAPQSTCSMTGVTTPASAFFSEGTVNSVGLLNASTSAAPGCYWDMTGVGTYQVIPNYVFPGMYSLPLTMTVTAN